MNHITDQPLTTANSAQAAPGLLLNEIDSRVVRVRPSATPLDQISRMGGSRRAGAMKVEYYSVETKPVAAVIDECMPPRNATDSYTITTSPATLLEPSETFLVPSADDTAPAVFYVVDRNKTNNRLTVIHVNAGADDAPLSLSQGTPIVRMGRAATELDVQTAQFQALPSKE